MQQNDSLATLPPNISPPQHKDSNFFSVLWEVMYIYIYHIYIY